MKSAVLRPLDEDGWGFYEPEGNAPGAARAPGDRGARRDARARPNFLDGGAIQFRIPADALARGEYSAVEAEPSSS